MWSTRNAVSTVDIDIVPFLIPIKASNCSFCHSFLPKLRNKMMGRMVKGELKRTSLTKERKVATENHLKEKLLSSLFWWKGRNPRNLAISHTAETTRQSVEWSSDLCCSSSLSELIFIIPVVCSFVKLLQQCRLSPKSNARDWLLNKTGVCFVYRSFHTTLMCLMIVAWTFYQTPNNAC